MDEVQVITQVISSVGFPIVACGALFWMINKTMSELTDAICELTQTLNKENEKEEGAHFG